MGIYEGLKVFEHDPICKKAMGNVKMRVTREANEKRGKLLGYKYGFVFFFFFFSFLSFLIIILILII